jgi:hypothetical protein
MATKTWETLKVRYCAHVNAEISLEAEVVYPADMLPDEAPRVLAHRCSNGVACSLNNQAACVWAGTNPTFDPFEEKD